MCGVGSLKYHARTVETETCLKSCCEICFLAAVVVLILGVFSVPIVVFYVKVGEQPIPPTVVSTTDPSGSACRQNGPPSNSTNCSSYSWADRVSSAVNCTAVPYTGGVCRGHLSAWQQCALGQSDSVWINNTGNMTAAETNAAIIINLLTSMECRTVAIPFYCQYLFPLCECATGSILLPSKEACLQIGTGACRVDWLQLQAQGFGHLLPNCDHFPNAAKGDLCPEPANYEFMFHNITEGSGGDDASGSFTTSVTELSPVTCRENFVLINSTCHPICHLWEQNTHAVGLTLRTIGNITGSMGLIIGLSAMVISFIDRKRMFKFPSVSVVYLNIGYCIYASFALVGINANKYLYCSSISLLVSINSPTLFCTLSGAVSHYLFVYMAMWWLVHVYFLFHKTMWPFHGKEIERRQKWIHLTVFIIAILAPLPGVLVVLTSSDYSYTIANFPPTFCAPDLIIDFYSSVLVVDTMFAIGTILIAVVLWRVHKSQGIFRKRKKRQVIISTVEKKLLIILSYYVLFGMVGLATSSLFHSNHSRVLFQSITTHFACEALGFIPGKCDRGLFEQKSFSWLFTLTFVFYAFIPIVSLVFVVDTKEIKRQLLMRCFNLSPRHRARLLSRQSTLYHDRIHVSNPSFKLPKYS